MVLAIAFESLVKLTAFLAVGVYAVYWLRNGMGDAYEHALALPQLASRLRRTTFSGRSHMATIRKLKSGRQRHPLNGTFDGRS
jgi:hypothetical protein